jgi:hypothetical protein
MHSTRPVRRRGTGSNVDCDSLACPFGNRDSSPAPERRQAREPGAMIGAMDTFVVCPSATLFATTGGVRSLRRVRYAVVPIARRSTLAAGPSRRACPPAENLDRSRAASPVVRVVSAEGDRAPSGTHHRERRQVVGGGGLGLTSHPWPGSRPSPFHPMPSPTSPTRERLAGFLCAATIRSLPLRDDAVSYTGGR